MPKLAAIVVAALGLVVPAVATAATPSFQAETFDATPGALSDVTLDLIVTSENAAPARIVIYVPQSYGLNTAAPAGTTVGTIDANAVVGGASLPIPTGNIVADSPASHVADACAPGTHAAVWVAHAASFAIPIYIDPTSGAEAALGAYKLVACLASPYVPESAGGAPSGARLSEAALEFTKTVLTNPSAASIYLWRALVTPYVVGTATPNATGTYELRSGAFIPGKLTIKKTLYNRKTKRATLTGKFTVLGKPIPGFPVFVFSISSTGAKIVGRTKTNKKGVYTVKPKITKRTTLTAVVFAPSGACDASTASPAPAGCMLEHDTDFFANILRVAPK